MFLTSFDSANVIGVEIGFFGQPLLAQMQPLPVFPDGGAKDNAIITGRHNQ